MQRRRSEDSRQDWDADADEALLPLDDEQQQGVIDSLKRAAQDQAAKFRQLFAVVYALIALMFLFFLLRLLTQPDHSLPHESVIGHLLSSAHFLCFYTLSVANFAGCAHICMSSVTLKQRRLSILQPLIALSALIAVVLLIIFIMNEETNPSVYWIPLVNLGGDLLLVYIERDFSSTLSDAEGMDRLRYSYKSI